MKLKQAFIGCLECNVTNFKKLNADDKKAIAGLIIASVTKSHWIYTDCLCVSNKAKRFYLGSSQKFQRLNERLGVFIAPHGDHYCFGSSTRSFNKPWTISYEVEQAISLFSLITLNEVRGNVSSLKFIEQYEKRQQQIVQKYSQKGANKTVVSLATRGANSWIKSTDTNQNMSKTYPRLKNCGMTQAIPVNIESLSHLVEDIQFMSLEELSEKYPDIKKAESDEESTNRKRVLWAAASTFALSEAVANNNTIPTVYTESTNGRLIIEGMSLQNVPKAVRNVCLKNMHSYDMSSCHWRLLYALTADYRLDYAMPETEKYINDKSGYRKEVAIKTGLPVAVVKEALIAIIFGGQCSMTEFSCFYKISNQSKEAQLKLVDALKPIANEVKGAGKFIVNQYEKKLELI